MVLYFVFIIQIRTLPKRGDPSIVFRSVATEFLHLCSQSIEMYKLISIFA